MLAFRAQVMEFGENITADGIYNFGNGSRLVLPVPVKLVGFALYVIQNTLIQTATVSIVVNGTALASIPIPPAQTGVIPSPSPFSQEVSANTPISFAAQAQLVEGSFTNALFIATTAMEPLGG